MKHSSSGRLPGGPSFEDDHSPPEALVSLAQRQGLWARHPNMAIIRMCTYLMCTTLGDTNG